MPPPKIVEYADLDFSKPVHGIEEIRLINPQRLEMEQLTAIVTVDPENRTVVGYKDVGHDEFWVNGHMPDFPLMPGVVLCECAAQLGGYYARKYETLGGDFIGFGGMNNVRFRRPVYPGDRLVLLVKLTRLRKGRRAEFQFQGWVNDQLVFNGEMIGVPITQAPETDDSDDA
ncbi:MAG: beta-hydroxyacyl-ACP dehydratase [Planctomycetota bacterium]|nr:beta-hydroxyacyl-ACP dehydratase [Planctomycetota bacterium]